jgi:hypothetical protein
MSSPTQHKSDDPEWLALKALICWIEYESAMRWQPDTAAAGLSQF